MSTARYQVTGIYIRTYVGSYIAVVVVGLLEEPLGAPGKSNNTRIPPATLLLCVWTRQSIHLVLLQCFRIKPSAAVSNGPRHSYIQQWLVYVESEYLVPGNNF